MKTIFITIDEILIIHDDLIKRYGGSFGIRDLGLIESALARPKATFSGVDLYPSIFEKAAALFSSLLLIHAFVDGNKRTSLTVTARFLHLNGFELEASQPEIVELPLSIEKDHLEIEQIEKWLKTHTKQILFPSS